MAGRASIVGAAATHVGKVRDHNEDAHFIDPDAGLFLVCDGMGGHAAGEVASALAVQTIRVKWLDEQVRRLADAWLADRTAEAKKRLFGVLRGGVVAAHDQILAEGARDDAKSGMGTTVVGALVIGNELVFAHAGDSRAYLVRDGIAMQLTEDHTLLARLLAAGIDVDVSGEGSRFRSMLTNALGIGQECKVATFVVPLADGDRFLLCSDGISEYVPEAEVGVVLTQHASPTRAAQRLVELALERGGGDNATALVIRVLEAGETPQPAEHLRLDEEAIRSCPLWGPKLTPQQRLRALRIAIPRDHASGDRVPAHTLGDRVAWIVLEGALAHDGRELGPGALVYPESLISDAPAPERDGLAVARTDVRALALRADDFRELCDDDTELGEALLETVGTLVSGRRRPGRITRGNERPDTEIDRRAPSNSDVIEPPPPVLAPLPIAARPTPPPPSRGTPPTGVPPAEPAPEQARPRTSPPHPPPGAPGRPRTATPPPLPGATSSARAAAPSRGSEPQLPRPSPLSGLQPRAPGPALPRTITPITDPRLPVLLGDAPARMTPRGLLADGDLDDRTEERLDDRTEERVDDHLEEQLDALLDARLSEHADSELGATTSPRIRRAPSEPEIETYYELDAEPPPLPDPDDDDDPIAEMTVSVDDGEARVTERVIETNEATVTLVLTEPNLLLDDEPTRVRAITADDAVSVSGTISVPGADPASPARPKPG